MAKESKIGRMKDWCKTYLGKKQRIKNKRRKAIKRIKHLGKTKRPKGEMMDNVVHRITRKRERYDQ
jgi:hypothetical protein